MCNYEPRLPLVQLSLIFFVLMSLFSFFTSFNIFILDMIKAFSRFCIYALVIISICANGSSLSQNNEEAHYFLRLVNLTALGPSDEPMITEFQWTAQEYTQRFSATFKVFRTFIARRIFIRTEKCRDLEIGCENFQMWNFTRFCRGLMMKNQIWSPILNAMKPKTLYQNCPRINQGTYTADDISVELDAIIKLYNEAPKYYWKIRIWFYNLKNEIEIKIYVHIFFTKYTNRFRIELSNEDE